MPRPLRVLFVDDSVYDCMLLVKELRHGGFEPRYTRVDSLPALNDELGRSSWDLSLVDYGIPGADAPAIIRAVRERNPEMPVIVISDVPGDEAAVATMTAGARDYVRRDKLDRLLPAIERELAEVEKRRASERVKEDSRRTEELLRLLAEASSEILTVLSPEGIIRYGTPSVERGLGYAAEEWTGAKVTQFIHPDDHATFSKLLANVAIGPGASHQSELRVRHKDGSWRTLDCLGKNLLDHPTVSGFLLDARDVTQRKHGATVARGETHTRTPPETTANREMAADPAAGAPTIRPGPRTHSELGRYRVVQLLGEGGMGTVYKAHDPKLDRLVAIKVPRFDVPRSDLSVVVQRFLREARSAAQVRHPNVCPIYDVDEQDGVPFVVMAFVDGSSLADYLRSRQRDADPADSARLARQVAVGLRAVHSHGIVHRDLKPANILLDRDGQALLTDFGLARPENESQRLTMHGAVIGTPGYMAPEQASGDAEKIGPWTDVYSLGVLLYVMLTGRLPYEGSALTILLRQLDEAPPPPSSLRAGLDPALEAIVLKAMSRQSADRHQSAQQFIDALDGWLAKLPPSIATASTIQTVEEKEK
jgi:PAS domain S-box-containing protein